MYVASVQRRQYLSLSRSRAFRSRFLTRFSLQSPSSIFLDLAASFRRSSSSSSGMYLPVRLFFRHVVCRYPLYYPEPSPFIPIRFSRLAHCTLRVAGIAELQEWGISSCCCIKVGDIPSREDDKRPQGVRQSGEYRGRARAHRSENAIRHLH